MWNRLLARILKHKPEQAPSTLLDELRKLQARNPKELDKESGICMYLTPGARKQFIKIVQSWPHYSGCWLYPIPMPLADTTRLGFHYLPATNRAKRAYYMLPHWEGAYGALRWRLIDWCIERLENEQ